MPPLKMSKSVTPLPLGLIRTAFLPWPENRLELYFPGNAVLTSCVYNITAPARCHTHNAADLCVGLRSAMPLLATDIDLDNGQYIFFVVFHKFQVCFFL